VSIDPVITVVLRWLLACLFASAAWHKLSDLTAFRIVLHDYHVLPPALVTPATGLVVMTEIALAAGFAWPASAPVAAWVATMLLASYGIAIAVNLARGRRTLECGCAPSAYRQPLSEWLLLRNAGLIGICAITLLPTAARPWAAVDWLTAAGAVATGAMAWAAAARLLALASANAVSRGMAR
jgi:uncharacterized membrane protein YphA (DoxX/SURF4 family)